MKICHIVGGGDFAPHLLRVTDGDLLIAADSGYAALCRAGFTPDLAIGDFDSLAETPACEVIRLPVRKDDTDVGAAIEYAAGAGYRRIRLYGALGGRRPSHSMANLALLYGMARRGIDAEILDERCTCRAWGVGEYPFPKSGGNVSFFALGDGAVVSLRGFLYPLTHYPLVPYVPLGVSNQVKENTGTLVVEEGFVLSFVERN